MIVDSMPVIDQLQHGYGNVQHEWAGMPAMGSMLMPARA
jgi:hypothetical protein